MIEPEISFADLTDAMDCAEVSPEPDRQAGRQADRHTDRKREGEREGGERGAASHTESRAAWSSSSECVTRLSLQLLTAIARRRACCARMPGALLGQRYVDRRRLE